MGFAVTGDAVESPSSFRREIKRPVCIADEFRERHTCHLCCKCFFPNCFFTFQLRNPSGGDGRSWSVTGEENEKRGWRPRVGVGGGAERDKRATS